MLPKGVGKNMDMIDSMMGCGSGSAADVRRSHGVPAWRYRYMPAWPNTDLGPETGAYHSSELPIVFGTTALRAEGKVKDTPEEAKVVQGEAKVQCGSKMTDCRCRDNDCLGNLRQRPRERPVEAGMASVRCFK
jgi:hypothetical protein